MVFLRRFASGLVAGVFAGPTLTGTTVALCEDAKSPFSRWPSSTFLSAGALRKSDVGEDTATKVPRVATADNFPIAQGNDPCDKVWGLPWLDNWDQPEQRDCDRVPPPSVDPRRSPKRQRQILLIRHGQYENEQTHDDTIRRLTPLGREQATLTGKYLAACFAQVARRDAIRESRRKAQAFLKHRETILAQTEKAGTESEDGLRVLRADVEQALATVRAHQTAEKSCGPSFVIASKPANIFVSNLKRAQETAALILEGFADGPDLKKRMVTDADLRERFPCDPEPRHPGHVAKAEDKLAVERAFSRYFHRPTRADEVGEINGKSVDIIVGHGNLIRYFALRALQLPPEAWLRQSLMHASITSIVISDNGKVKINALGSFGHLPPSMVTVENIGYNASGTKS